MRRVVLLIVTFSFLGCASQPTVSSYRVRTLGVHGDGGEHLEMSGVSVTLSINQGASHRKRIDVKALIHNKSESQVVLRVADAELRSTSKSWAPVDWTVYCHNESAHEVATVEPGEQCWLMCSFEVRKRSRERFPKSVTVNIGNVRIDGEEVDMGPIQLHIPG